MGAEESALPARLATPVEINTIRHLQKLLGMPFSEELNTQDLRRLWRAAGLIDTDFARTGSPWSKRLGFQRDDPTSDLRGGGVLALVNLIAYLEADAGAVESMVKRSCRGQEGLRNYPWAATGVNITRMLCEVLDIIHASGKNSDNYERERRPYWHVFQCISTFNALYIFTFKLLDRLFDENDGTYLEMPRVLQLTRMRVIDALTTDPSELPLVLRPPPFSPDPVGRCKTPYEMTPTSGRYSPSSMTCSTPVSGCTTVSAVSPAESLGSRGVVGRSDSSGSSSGGGSGKAHAGVRDGLGVSSQRMQLSLSEGSKRERRLDLLGINGGVTHVAQIESPPYVEVTMKDTTSWVGSGCHKRRPVKTPLTC